MVNPDSDLYRAHPDWVLNYPGRPRTEGRNQLVLDLARADVRDHRLAVLDRPLRENAIQFLRWDHNRNWTEPGWPEAPPADRQRVYVDYVRNLYAILAELRRRGLDPVRTYPVRMLGGGALPADGPATATGAWWMGQGR